MENSTKRKIAAAVMMGGSLTVFGCSALVWHKAQADAQRYAQSAERLRPVEESLGNTLSSCSYVSPGYLSSVHEELSRQRSEGMYGYAVFHRGFDRVMGSLDEVVRSAPDQAAARNAVLETRDAVRDWRAVQASEGSAAGEMKWMQGIFTIPFGAFLLYGAVQLARRREEE